VAQGGGRSLQLAFQARRGMSPMRFVADRRLAPAHRLFAGLSGVSADGSSDAASKHQPTLAATDDSHSMTPRLGVVGKAFGFLVCLASLTACEVPSDPYIAAAEMTRHGFARDEAAARRITGQTIRIWGFVDHANLYGDRGAREILGEWWSGEASDPATWRFNLKAHPDDKAPGSRA
jgi:hypothetical protein